MAQKAENGGTHMVRTTMAIPIDLGGGQVAKINLPPGATLAGPVKVMTLANGQTIAHVTVMAPPGVVEKYVAQVTAESEGKSVPDKPPESAAPPVMKPAPAPKPSVPAPAPPPKQPSPLLQPPQMTRSGGPSNLFDKLSSSKQSANIPQKPPTESVPAPVPDRRDPESEKFLSSDSDDDLPLSKLASQKPTNSAPEKKQTVPAPKKKASQKKQPAQKPPPEKKPAAPKKPQTGFQSYLEEKRPEILARNPRLSEKEVSKQAKSLWEMLDVPRKNHYIRNSEAYKIKKGIITTEQLNKNEKQSKLQKQPPSSPIRDPRAKSSSTSKPANENTSKQSDTPTSSDGYSHPKRNVKRKYFDVEENYDAEDTDWTMPEPEPKKPQSAFESSLMPSSMPPLRFKKKSRPPSESDPEPVQTPKVEKMSKNDDIDLPTMMDIDSPATQPPPITKAETLRTEQREVRESTPPPPLRKIENVAPPVERKHNLQLICLLDGCYEEAQSEQCRGKYWCSDKCCILYSKAIFNAWVGARRANMID